MGFKSVGVRAGPSRCGRTVALLGDREYEPFPPLPLPPPPLQVPFEARSVNELRYKVLKGTYPALPSTYSRDLQQMVRDCLDPNPDRRPTMDQVGGMCVCLGIMSNEAGMLFPRQHTAGGERLQLLHACVSADCMMGGCHCQHIRHYR